MTVYCIIHAGTRVIRRWTTEQPPVVVAGELAIASAAPVSNPPFRWCRLDLDDITILEASAEQAADAGINEELIAQRRRAVRDAMLVALDNAVAAALLTEQSVNPDLLQANVRTMARTLRVFLAAQGRLYRG